MSRLMDLRDRHRGKRCVLVANGPSLAQMDLGFLRHEYTIGMNKIFLGLAQFGFYPNYYVAVNHKVVAQSAAEIKALNCVKLISRSAAPGLIAEDALTHYLTTHAFDMDAAGATISGFHQDIARDGVFEGWTVTHVGLQLAYYLGFQQVVIIGMDHRFTFTGGPNEAQVLEGADPNHFSPAYFGGGQSWDTPDLPRSEESYALARRVFEADGREILDATPNGACTVFPKVNYREIFPLSYA